MTCSSPVAGSVTNPTGSVNGTSLTDLTDAYTERSGYTVSPGPGIMAQWQQWVELSNHTDQCGRYRTNKRYAGEKTLRLVVTGWKAYPDDAPAEVPTADLPLTIQVQPGGGSGNVVVTSDGVSRQLRAYQMNATSRCQPGSDTEASSGSVTFTAWDATTVDGSYDLYFGTSNVTGTFTAPWCSTVDCTARPSKASCV